MRNEGQKPQGGAAVGRGSNGFIPSSFRALSGYLRIVSSGASTVASSVRSAAQSIALDRDNDARHDQVLWAGFDKLEFRSDYTRRVLLLGYQSGFQVWDVEEAHNVHDLVSVYDGPVSFLQMVPKPLSSVGPEDKYLDSRPLLVVYTDGSLLKDGKGAPSTGTISKVHAPENGLCGPSTVRFYSLTSQSYVHILKFRSSIYSIRCSSRVIAVSQAAQVHCFNAATLEKEYTILTNPVVTSCPGSKHIGYGPLALGPRWLAYSGSPIGAMNAGRVSPTHLKPSATFPSPASNGNRVALYAKESSKHLASGIVTLGDRGYKKLSQYCSELRSNSSEAVQPGVIPGKSNGTVYDHLRDMDNVGMVIVKDVLSKALITQFRAHKSPISALCFDSSGTLLVTASVQGHNINVFRILPSHSGVSSEVNSNSSYVHLYRLQRGFTNAIIQDIAFSGDSRWIMISSSRGTNHLFAISPYGGTVDLQFADPSSGSNGLCVMSKEVVRWAPKLDGQVFKDSDLFASGPPVTLSVVSRIRNSNSGWRGTVNGAAAVATGKNSSVSGAIAAVFHLCKGHDMHVNPSSSTAKYHLLVFSPLGSLIQYALRTFPAVNTAAAVTGVEPAYETVPGCDSKLIVEATQKWNICSKRRDREDNCDIYGENGSLESSKVCCEQSGNGYGAYPIRRVTSTLMTPEERNHFYMSEAELHMHERRDPLWAKSEIYFQSMIIEGTKVDAEIAEGEIEIEKISARTVEARSKGLMPVFDNLDNPKSQWTRNAAVDYNNGPLVLPQMSGFPEDGDFPASGHAGILTENGAELSGGVGEFMNGALRHADLGKGFVNTNDSPKRKSELQIVNNRDREHFKMEYRFKYVNT